MEQKLGRGLSAIFGGDDINNDDVSSRSSSSSLSNNTERGGSDNMRDKISYIDIEMVIPNKDQPRRTFDSAKLQELSDSIALHGVIQPLAVRRHNNNNGREEYILLAGERRLRAAKMAGLKEVPVHIVDCSDSDILALSLIENIQRDNLNPVEEAEAMERLIAEHNCTQENLAFLICKSRSYIANSMRLLSLPENVKGLIQAGGLSAGHARCLVGVDNAYEIAVKALSSQMSVRDLEEYIKVHKSGNQKEIQERNDRDWTPLQKEDDSDASEISERLTNALGIKTKLKITNNGGIITIRCRSCEELENLTNTLLSINEIKQ